MSAGTVGEPTMDDEQKVWELRLYVMGQSPKSTRAHTNLKKFCEDYLAGRYRIEIVDLGKKPSQARIDNIIAIPTLERKRPKPQRRFVGDLSATDKLRDDLGLAETNKTETPL